MTQSETAMRKVDLVDQITTRLTHGFDICPEDIAEAESLGIDIKLIADTVGACYEDFGLEQEDE